MTANGSLTASCVRARLALVGSNLAISFTGLSATLAFFQGRATKTSNGKINGRVSSRCSQYINAKLLHHTSSFNSQVYTCVCVLLYKWTSRSSCSTQRYTYCWPRTLQNLLSLKISTEGHYRSVEDHCVGHHGHSFIFPLASFSAHGQRLDER
jgi:hypothetical protein